jgi:6-phosphogluconate dehydrogenase
LGYKDENGKKPLTLFLILPGKKEQENGLGISALDLGIPLTLIGESVFPAACRPKKIYGYRHQKSLTGQKPKFEGDRNQFLDDMKDGSLRGKNHFVCPGLQPDDGSCQKNTAGT